MDLIDAFLFSMRVTNKITKCATSEGWSSIGKKKLSKNLSSVGKADVLLISLVRTSGGFRILF